MEEAGERVNCAANAVCDGLRYLGDATYAILPRDIAHALGDLKKAVLTNVRSLIDWEIDWVDERIAGGDRLREEWQQACSRDESSNTASEAAGPAS
jgi:hypothetical protein